MLTNILLYFLVPNLAVTQTNSKFSWSNKGDLKDVELLFPHFEILRKFINDERKMNDENETTDNVNFNAVDYYEEKLPKPGVTSQEEGKDNNHPLTDTNKIENNSSVEETSQKMLYKKQNSADVFVLHFPIELGIKLNNLKSDRNNLTISFNEKEETMKPQEDFQGKESNTKEIFRRPAISNNDDLVFNFTDEVKTAWKDVTVTRKVFSPTKSPNNNQFDKVIKGNPSLKMDQPATERICTYLKKTKCQDKNGFIYTPKSSESIKFINSFLVCCILLLPTEEDFAPDPAKSLNRYRRSNKDISPLNQREFLLKNKFGSHSKQPTGSNTKIVTPDDDFVDPYWNIKNSNLKGSNKQGVMKQEYYQDYGEDYVEELPRPGLEGIYSDNGNKPHGWVTENDNPNAPYGASNDYSDESEGGFFGYSTIDPRRVTASKSQRRRPVKITTVPPEEDTPFDIESQTVNFQSNPNFQVLQGFKILNLGRTKNKYNSKNSKRSTTESSVENDSGENSEDQAFRNCGKTSENRRESESREIGEAESHPWLAVVVASRRPQNVLCYATIIHPRAAITAGDCVNDFAKRTPGKDVLAIVAGLRELKDRSETQNRIVTVKMHPQWRRENLAHNLAILHWNRPLRLSPNIQPACLSSSHDQDDCRFYGWGGFDQAMRQSVRWQKASVVSGHDCTAHISKTTKLPNDAFCATVKARGTVTGRGGSLICNVDGYATSVGVAVYRDKAVVLIPAHDWILRAMEDLNIE